MKISDLINHLEKLKAQEGDLELRIVEIFPYQEFYKNGPPILLENYKD